MITITISEEQVARAEKLYQFDVLKDSIMEGKCYFRSGRIHTRLSDIKEQICR